MGRPSARPGARPPAHAADAQPNGRRSDGRADPSDGSAHPGSDAEPTPKPTPKPTPAPTPEPTPPSGQAPRVDFDFSVNGLRVSFGNHTKGADHWMWDFGDGETSTARRPSHTYGGPGRYSVTLTAWSTGGAVASESQDVTVSDG